MPRRSAAVAPSTTAGRFADAASSQRPCAHRAAHRLQQAELGRRRRDAAGVLVGHQVRAAHRRLELLDRRHRLHRPDAPQHPRRLLGQHGLVAEERLAGRDRQQVRAEVVELRDQVGAGDALMPPPPPARRCRSRCRAPRAPPAAGASAGRWRRRAKASRTRRRLGATARRPRRSCRASAGVARRRRRSPRRAAPRAAAASAASSRSCVISDDRRAGAVQVAQQVERRRRPSGCRGCPSARRPGSAPARRPARGRSRRAGARRPRASTACAAAGGRGPTRSSAASARRRRSPTGTPA